MEFTATNGILQGCPISVILVNALMARCGSAVSSAVVTHRQIVFLHVSEVYACMASVD